MELKELLTLLKEFNVSSYKDENVDITFFDKAPPVLHSGSLPPSAPSALFQDTFSDDIEEAKRLFFQELTKKDDEKFSMVES